MTALVPYVLMLSMLHTQRFVTTALILANYVMVSRLTLKAGRNQN